MDSFLLCPNYISKPARKDSFLSHSPHPPYPSPPPPTSHSDSFFLCPNYISKPARRACTQVTHNATRLVIPCSFSFAFDRTSLIDLAKRYRFHILSRHCGPGAPNFFKIIENYGEKLSSFPYIESLIPHPFQKCSTVTPQA